MAQYGHTLVIGGTGMLGGATRDLAGRSEVLTAVARTTSSLRALADSVADTNCVLHEVALDWSDPEAFLSALGEHLERSGPPSLVLAWLRPACRFRRSRGCARTAPSAAR